MKQSLCEYGSTTVLEVSFEKTIPSEELKRLVSSGFEFCKKNNIKRILSDCTTLDGGHTLFDLLELAEEFSGIAESFEFREAVLVCEGMRAIESVRFWETACVNRGIQVKLFLVREEALKWLLE